MLSKRLANLIFCCSVALFVGACSGGGGGDSGSSGDACADLNIKILNGDQCKQAASPVVLVVAQATDQSFMGLCTGTLITPTKVLTAAHCMVFNTPVTMAVRAGDQLIGVSSAAYHPNFVAETGVVSDYDIGVLTLARPSSIPTVPLIGSRQVSGGEQLAVFGYGIDQDGKGVEAYGVDALKATHVKVTALQDNLIITSYDDTKTGACEGDSGGPLTAQINGTTGIVGVVQGGSNPGNPSAAGCGDGFYDIFTSVHRSSVFNFIMAQAPGARVI